MATTLEKMQALAAEIRQQALDETSDEAAGFVTLIQLGAGFGIDVFEWLIPNDEAEADLFVDELIALMLRVRGDDLPPFSADLYGEANSDAPSEDLSGVPTEELTPQAALDPGGVEGVELRRRREAEHEA